MTADRAALRLRLRALFLDELDQHVGVLNDGFLRLERGDGRDLETELVNELFRSAHSLKGAASAVGVPPVEAVCHRLEEVLGTVRDGTVTLSALDFEPLFGAVDIIAAAGSSLREGGDATGLPVAEILRGLAAAASSEADGATPSPAITPVAEPAITPVAEPAITPTARPEERRVRVAASRLDTLLNQAGELLLASRRVHDLAGGISAVREAMTDHARGQASSRLDDLLLDATSADRLVAAAARSLVDEVRLARMLPFVTACEGLERVARDVARAAGKEALVEIEGGEVELDRPIVDALREPLLHLVRNAVDHGLESPDLRSERGKPPVGRVVVNARVEGSTVAVKVTDDGGGMDLAALRRAAERHGVGALGDDGRSALDLALLPGLSTAQAVTEVSGRGVGLDAVRARVEALGGAVRLFSQPGSGTSIVLDLPLTVSAIRVLFFAAGGEQFGFPSTSVTRVLRVRRADLRDVDGRDVLLVDGRAVPVLRLSESLGLQASSPPSRGRFDAVVVSTGKGEVLVAVDELIGEEEVVMKPVGERLEGVPGILGATVLPTGRVALVLNPATSLRQGIVSSQPMEEIPTDRQPTRVLLAEDSLTTRALERSILEAAGYEVVVAVDGLEAWQLLQEHGADVVVSDVDMPRMDGLALCAAIRASNRFRDLPFVLVTSLATEQDRRRGAEAGANAYIVKADFEQGSLLDAVERLT